MAGAWWDRKEGTDGQGRDGPWNGAVELRRKRTRGVSKWGGGGRNIRLDEAAAGTAGAGLSCPGTPYVAYGRASYV